MRSQAESTALKWKGLLYRKRLLAEGKLTEADYGGPLPPSDDENADDYRGLGPRRRFLQRKEDRVMLWAWFRWSTHFLGNSPTQA